MVALAVPAREKVIGRPASHMRLATDDSGYSAEALRLDHSLIAHRQPRLNLKVRNLSMDGLSAISEQPVNRGEQVGISFPGNGLHRTCTAIGRVTRCEPTAHGYRIAVEFDPLPAA